LLLRPDLNKKKVWFSLKFRLDMADNYSILVVKDKDMSNITQKFTCRKCGVSEDITFNFNDYTRWKDGEYIQEVLDYLTSDERELMLSNTCGKCFDIMFPPLDNN